MIKTYPNIREFSGNCSGGRNEISTQAGGSLDTLAQLRKPLDKRASSKYFTNKLAIALADRKGELEQYYRNAFYCNHVLTQAGEKITGKYCKTRICNTCNRIRMANLIEGYSPILEKYTDLQFVTLTIPNVSASELKSSISLMGKSFVKLLDRFRKRGIRPNGLRKLEITYNARRKDYHPHYHLIVSNKDVAQMIVAEWIKHNPAADIKAQNIRVVTSGSYKELFKYAAKVVTKINGKQVIILDAVDTIIQSLYSRRIIQPFGDIRKQIAEDIEDIDELQSDLYDIPYYELMSWTWRGEDWVNEYGECLTGYTPSDIIRNLVIDSG